MNLQPEEWLHSTPRRGFRVNFFRLHRVLRSFQAHLKRRKHLPGDIVLQSSQKPIEYSRCLTLELTLQLLIFLCSFERHQERNQFDPAPDAIAIVRFAGSVIR